MNIGMNLLLWVAIEFLNRFECYFLTRQQLRLLMFVV
jgi:hypothetical protein